MNVPDSRPGMIETVVRCEVHLLADRLLELLTERDLVVRINPLKEGFESRERSTRVETLQAVTFLGPVPDLAG